LQIYNEKNNFYCIPVKKSFSKTSKINDFILEKNGLNTLIEILKGEFSKGKQNTLFFISDDFIF